MKSVSVIEVLHASGSTFATGSDRIKTRGTVIFEGTNYLNADVLAAGTGFEIIARENAVLVFGNTAGITLGGMTFNAVENQKANLVFSQNATVAFTKQDLSAANITIDNSGYTGGNVIIASGIAELGTVSFSEYSDRFNVSLSVGKLMYSAIADVQAGDTVASFTGGSFNVITGGEITGAFFGTTADSGSVKSVISNGFIGDAVIGGTKVASGSTAAMDKVTLNISGGDIKGGEYNGGQIYTAGYAYGHNADSVDSEVTLAVAKSELNLVGGSFAAENIFAGAHARKGAYTKVDETVITVTDGTYHRVYGGGWAELNGLSEVGSATITATGGDIDRLYAGGANASGGATVTGSAAISVGGSANVDFVFLGGKNLNCSMSGDASLTLSGDTKYLIRISGRNGNGSDNTAGITSLTVATDTTVDCIDYVDILNLTQGSTLEITDLAQYDNGSDATLNFLTDDLSSEWTALSGAGFEVFQSAHFQINGVEYTRSGDGMLGDSGYKLTFDDNERSFIISKLA